MYSVSNPCFPSPFPRTRVVSDYTTRHHYETRVRFIFCRPVIFKILHCFIFTTQNGCCKPAFSACSINLLKSTGCFRHEGQDLLVFSMEVLMWGSESIFLTAFSKSHFSFKKFHTCLSIKKQFPSVQVSRFIIQQIFTIFGDVFDF